MKTINKIRTISPAHTLACSIKTFHVYILYLWHYIQDDFYYFSTKKKNYFIYLPEYLQSTII